MPPILGTPLPNRSWPPACGLPLQGAALISVNDFDKGAGLKVARDLLRLGLSIAATPGTAEYFQRVGLPVEVVNKVSQGSPHVVDLDPSRAACSWF